jgi:hypothetical protein
MLQQKMRMKKFYHICIQKKISVRPYQVRGEGRNLVQTVEYNYIFSVYKFRTVLSGWGGEGEGSYRVMGYCGTKPWN